MHSGQPMALGCGLAVAFYLCVAGSVLAQYKHDKHACGSSGGLAISSDVG